MRHSIFFGFTSLHSQSSSVYRAILVDLISQQSLCVVTMTDDGFNVKKMYSQK